MATNVLELRRFDRAAPAPEPGDDFAVRTEDDILPAAQRLAREARRHGLRIMAWHDLATLAVMTDAEDEPLATCAFGWSEAELAEWHAPDRALRSPLLRAARLADEPLWLDTLAIRSPAPGRLLERLDLSALPDPAGPRAAIVAPVHMPLGQVGAAVLTSLDPQEKDLGEAFARAAGWLCTAAVRFVSGYAALRRDTRYLPTDCLLTSREIECLSWVAHGKTDYEISIILGCSHAGVRYHVTRACAKLGAVNRAQSVFRAAQLGYLGVPVPPTPGPRESCTA